MTHPSQPARHHFMVTSLAVGLALSACQPRSDADTPAGAPTAPAPAAPAPAASTADAPRSAHAVTGTATYLERIRMPPGGSLRVQLLDNQLADTPQAVIAEVTHKDVEGPPYAFSLPFDPAKLRPGSQYGLHAALSGPDGKLWFVSDTRVPVDPAANLPVEIRMVRAQAAGTVPASTASSSVTHWQCGESRVGATFDAKTERVELSINGRILTLPLARSASGARYADERGNEFWTKGASGTLTLADEGKHDCTQAEGASPWDSARARNVAFRAVGNEPGWLVEVGQGDTPPLHAQLDFGARTLDIAQVTRSKDGLRFDGKTANGTEVKLTIERKPCQDDMSGARFGASAQLHAGGKVYRGCGAFMIEDR